MSENTINPALIPAAQWASAVLPILEKGHSLKLPIEGLSMYPLLTGGRDEVIISSITGKKLKRGDIVLFIRSDGTHVLHRIYQVKEGLYYMLGDAQTWIEGPIARKDILAITTTVIRKGRKIDCSRYGYKVISSFWLWGRYARPWLLRIIFFFCRMIDRFKQV